MTDFQLKTPIAFLIFNRPDTTARVFEEIRRARPSRLLVVADGPRPDRAGEAEKCSATRAIIEQVNWPCDVLKNYSETNLGCKRRVSGGLDWIFQSVEEAIIMEDDCLPHPTFFRFCEELLEYYRNDERVMHIGGCNFQDGIKRGNGSYYFSAYNHIWGWASWRRAWKYYDVSISSWRKTINEKLLKNLFTDKKTANYWKIYLDKVQKGKVDTWDCQWAFALWAHDGLAVLPQNNLVSNIGFGSDSTHTADLSIVANIPTVAMEFPLVHPQVSIRDVEAERYTDKLFFRMPNIIKRLSLKVKYIFFDRLCLYIKSRG